MIRLDRFLSASGSLTRSQAAKAIRAGRVLVNGSAFCTPDQKISEGQDEVMLDGSPVRYQKYHYYLLDKPTGIITASRDPKQNTVLDLFPQEVRRQGIFPVGRLDKDTSGLLILTDDGDFAHRVISPRSGIWKVYEASVAGALTQRHVQLFADGIQLMDGTLCLPSELHLISPDRCLVKVQEGKYHQVRRMLATVGCPVISLRRLSVGGLCLEENSIPGSWRALLNREVALVLNGSVV